MSWSFSLKGYPASLIWTLLQRDTSVSPGMLLGSRAPIPTGRDSCVSPCPGSEDRALSLLRTACKAGVLGSAFPLASSQAGGSRILSCRTSPGSGGEGCASQGSNGRASLPVVTSH